MKRGEGNIEKIRLIDFGVPNPKGGRVDKFSHSTCSGKFLLAGDE